MERVVLGYQDECQRDAVDDKVGRMVVCVGGGQEEEEYGYDGQELSGGCVLDPMVQLFPMSQHTGRALVAGAQPGRGLGPVQNEEADYVVSHIGGRPDPGHGETGHRHRQQDQVEHGDAQHVKQPETTAVHVDCVGVLHPAASGHHLLDAWFKCLFGVLSPFD